MVMDGIFRIVISTFIIRSIASPLHAVSSFSTLITFDVDGTLVSSSPGWELGVRNNITLPLLAMCVVMLLVANFI